MRCHSGPTAPMRKAQPLPRLVGHHAVDADPAALVGAGEERQRVRLAFLSDSPLWVICGARRAALPFDDHRTRRPLSGPLVSGTTSLPPVVAFQVPGSSGESADASFASISAQGPLAYVPRLSNLPVSPYFFFSHSFHSLRKVVA